MMDATEAHELSVGFYRDRFSKVQRNITNAIEQYYDSSSVEHQPTTFVVLQAPYIICNDFYKSYVMKSSLN